MADRICQCGSEIPSSAHGRRTHCFTCSPYRKRDDYKPKPVKKTCAVCVVCGDQFTTNADTPHCGSSRCKWASQARRPCDQCGDPTGWRPTDKRAGTNVICRTCRNKKIIQRTEPLTSWVCEYCGKTCERPPVRGQKPRYCGKKHEQLAAYNRRRARKKDAFVEEVIRIEVFIADGYRCHLCGCKTDPTKSVPHRRAPTVDHIIPLSKGGMHERSNCRTACFSCNCRKQDRGGGEQLLLIG